MFKDARMDRVSRYGEGGPRPAGMVMTAEFELNGQRFLALNGGPEYTFTEAISFQIPCADQDEVDYYWDRLTADGGQPGPCGWLKDRFGLSWQVVPAGLGSLLSDPDPEKATRARRPCCRWASWTSPSSSGRTPAGKAAGGKGKRLPEEMIDLAAGTADVAGY